MRRGWGGVGKRIARGNSLRQLRPVSLERQTLGRHSLSALPPGSRLQAREGGGGQAQLSRWPCSPWEIKRSIGELLTPYRLLHLSQITQTTHLTFHKYLLCNATDQPLGERTLYYVRIERGGQLLLTI